MGKHLNPLEKEFLIRQYKSNPRLKMKRLLRNTTASRWERFKSG